ncbi:hypothetical protein V6N11_071266 [Hibiscus sabdariffa]|uniref:Uncharacterized protein n=1 Tax=Hibiscus sabdariffa TaxID=183260 RepID=A0ABR2TZK3_9ROSI
MSQLRWLGDRSKEDHADRHSCVKTTHSTFELPPGVSSSSSINTQHNRDHYAQSSSPSSSFLALHTLDVLPKQDY